MGKQMDAHVRDEGQDALRAMRQANTKERTRADAEEDGCQSRHGCCVPCQCPRGACAQSSIGRYH